jgi:transcriptional repressor NrdR
MQCPYCGSQDTRVLETRVSKSGHAIKRRRECMSCKSRLTTHEVLELDYPMIVKKDGRRETFSRDKLLSGLLAACQKRPIAQSQIETVVESISNKILQRGEKEISSELIGRFVMVELKKLDQVAYVRFASVYMSFKEVNEFVESIGGDQQWV